MQSLGELYSEPVVRLSGGLEVTGAKNVPTSAQDRGALTLFAVNAGDVVPVRDFVKELWGPGADQQKCRSGVYAVVKRLRDGAGLPIVSEGMAGYRLAMAPSQVDVLRFLLAVKALRAHPPNTLVEAMAAWSGVLSILRGPVFDYIAPGVVLQGWAKRIQADQLTARHQLYHIHLCQGQHLLIVERLWVDWAAQPARQDLACLLMVAFYRSLRAPEAAWVYTETQQALKEFGFNPSRRLKCLDERIQREDQELLDYTQPLPGF